MDVATEHHLRKGLAGCFFNLLLCILCNEICNLRVQLFNSPDVVRAHLENRFDFGVNEPDETLICLVVLGIFEGEIQQAVVDASYLFILKPVGVLQPMYEFLAQLCLVAMAYAHLVV